MLRAEPEIVATGSAPRLHRVVCGVDGLAAGHEAVRQAAALAGGDGFLELVAVTPAPGHPHFLPLPNAAAAALADAGRTAASVPTTTRTVSSASVAHGLARAAADADVIVVGCREVQTAHGVTLGPVTEPLLAIAPCSVLVVRRPPDLALFDVIVVAEDDSPQDEATTAAQLAIEYGAETRVVTTAAAVNAAAAIGSGLIVTADGPHATRLAREAPCSVLIVRDRR
jgi:nucleotide-binding universal stress UspA family protein